jgi:RNA polymerase sigma-70 factor (sigma-E family)
VTDFDAFVSAELAGLLRFGAVLTGDRQLAHDVVTDAVLKAGRRWDRMAGMDHPVAYTRRMIVSNFLSAVRAADRRRTDVMSPAAFPERPGPDATAPIADRDEIRSLLATLTAPQRAAIVLRYYLDLTDEAIAEQLDCAPATVRSHLARGLAALRVSTAATSQEG